MEPGVEGCSICWVRLVGSLAIPEGCTHKYHQDCLDRWVSESMLRFPRNRVKCPLCRIGNCQRPLTFVRHQPYMEAVPDPVLVLDGQWRPNNTPHHLTCEICGKVFETTSAKAHHLKSHAGPFVCTMCHKSYKYMPGLDKNRRQTNH